MSLESENSVSSMTVAPLEPRPPQGIPLIPPTTAASLRETSDALLGQDEASDNWVAASLASLLLIQVLDRCEWQTRRSSSREQEIIFWLNTIVSMICEPAALLGFRDQKKLGISCVRHLPSVVEPMKRELAVRGFMSEFQYQAGSHPDLCRLWVKVEW